MVTTSLAALAGAVLAISWTGDHLQQLVDPPSDGSRSYETFGLLTWTMVAAGGTWFHYQALGRIGRMRSAWPVTRERALEIAEGTHWDRGWA